jgi:hypothetical protein
MNQSNTLHIIKVIQSKCNEFKTFSIKGITEIGDCIENNLSHSFNSELFSNAKASWSKQTDCVTGFYWSNLNNEQYEFFLKFLSKKLECLLSVSETEQKVGYSDLKENTLYKAVKVINGEKCPTFICKVFKNVDRRKDLSYLGSPDSGETKDSIKQNFIENTKPNVQACWDINVNSDIFFYQA